MSSLESAPGVGGGRTHTATLPCALCGETAEFDSSFGDIFLFRCRKCRHVFTDTTRLTRFEEYELGYFESEHANWFAHPNVKLFETIAQVIEGEGADADVIDVGCGRGAFLRYLEGRLPRASLTGVDLIANESSERIEFLTTDVLELELERQFDVVINMAIIEHISDVHPFIERLRGLARPGGIVVTMTVDSKSILYDVARILDRAGYSGPFQRLYDRHHLHHFTGSSLTNALEMHGLATTKIIRHNSPLAAVDIPGRSGILRVGVAGCSALGWLTGRTYLQTVVSRKQESGDGRVSGQSEAGVSSSHLSRSK
jgi:SAM-dependent methyltransferase